MSKKDLAGKVQELKEWKALQKEMEEIMKALEEEIKAEMEAVDAELLQVGIFTVRYQEITSLRFNSRAFQADHKALYDAYKTPNTYRRLTVA